MSGKTNRESGMVFRREGVPMGIPGFDEWNISVTDENAVRAARKALDA
jgi:copper homeostasis protein